MPQLASTANTPDEIIPKVLRLVGDLKLGAVSTGDQRAMEFAIKLETMVLEHYAEPLDEMAAGGGGMGGGGMGAGSPMPPPMSMPPSGMGMGGMGGGMPGGMPAAGPAAAATMPGAQFGSPGGPGGAPDIDEIARMLP